MFLLPVILYEEKEKCHNEYIPVKKFEVTIL